jgi:hypothetical protein
MHIAACTTNKSFELIVAHTARALLHTVADSRLHALLLPSNVVVREGLAAVALTAVIAPTAASASPDITLIALIIACCSSSSIC